MYRITIAAVALLTLSACAHHGRIDYSAPAQKSLQESAMARWNRCLDMHLEEQGTIKASAYVAIRSSVKLCEGHSHDVLATYPRLMEEPLAEKLYAIAMTQGMRKLYVQDTEKVLLQKALPELQISEN